VLGEARAHARPLVRYLLLMAVAGEPPPGAGGTAAPEHFE
jgi:hypothetical protein